MRRHFAIIGSRGYPSTYGGFETFVRKLAPYLVENGDEVSVYCRHGSRGVRTVDGIRCITTRGIETNSSSTLSHGLAAAFDARKRGFDAALVLNVANGYFLPILKRAGIPAAVNVDGVEWQREKWNRAARAIFYRGARITARYADTIVVDSKEIGRIWKVEFDRDGVFLPYGADLTYEAGHDRVQGLGLAPETYALAVARLVPENNVDLFLDALDRLGPEQPAVVVGSASTQGGHTVERLKRMVASRSSFQWLGHVDDQVLLRQLWANCAVYFHGHSAGGTNPALLQALGYGAPTLALRTPFNCEVLGDDSQTVAADADEIANLITKLMNDEAERSRIAQSGKDLVRSRYTWKAVLGGYRDLLHELAASRKPTENPPSA